jgi:hypothetical protein
VIQEGLRGSPAISTARVERLQQTVKTSDGSYELTAHLSIVDGRHYLDYTEVKRR